MSSHILRHINDEFIEIARAQTLQASSTTYFGPTFPLGEAWIRFHMRISINLTLGTGSTALSEGELQVIKAIYFKTDRGEIICNNTPGRLLYRMTQIKFGTAPVKTAIAAATGIYIVPLDIWFSDPFRLAESEQHATVLDTKRYGSLQLGITMGAVSDLLGTPGTATVAFTTDLYVQRFRGILPKGLDPVLYTTYGVFPPQNPNNQTYVDMERSENLAYKRLFVMGTSVTTLPGVPYSGNADDTIINDMDIEITEKFAYQNILSNVLQRQNQIDYQLEAIPAGCNFFSWVDKSQSLKTVLKSAGQSRMRLNWRNLGGLPATPQVTLGFEGIRPLIG
jgi:hypothetical protein